MGVGWMRRFTPIPSFPRQGGRSSCYAAERFFVFAQRPASVRSRVPHHLRRRAGADDLAAGVAAFRAEVDHPVAGGDHVEVVFDHDQRIAGGDQLTECAQQFRHVVEVQPGRRFVE